ncbi:hypothetical protein DENSPDRAFT_885443, partial [Dentipellis sp. KUC8613]
MPLRACLALVWWRNLLHRAILSRAPAPPSHTLGPSHSPLCRLRAPHCHLRPAPLPSHCVTLSSRPAPPV